MVRFLGLMGLCWMCLVSGPAQAAVKCPLLFSKTWPDNTYIALAFTDPAWTAQQRDQLAREITPRLNDIANALNESSKGAKLKMQLVVCQYTLTSTDFDSDEMKEFLTYKVVAIFWREPEGARHTLVQLAVPAYLRTEDATRFDMEVATPYPVDTQDDVQNWIEALSSAPYKPFISMGMASAYAENKDYLRAWRALCESRLGLAALEPERPKREALAKKIAEPLRQWMGELGTLAKPPGNKLPPCVVNVGAPSP